jgi:hypothetical protein
MSTLKINTLSNGGSEIDFPNSFNVGGNAIEQGYTSSGTEPSSPAIGDIWWDSTNEKLYQYLNSEFKEITIVVPVSFYGDRALFAGSGSDTDGIEYFSISTDTSSTSFGNLTAGGDRLGSVSSGTYGVFAGGQTTARNTVIDYVTIATAADAADFGDLISSSREQAPASDGTYGIFAGGNRGNAIDYITIATPANSTDFGDLTASTGYGPAGMSNSVYGVIAGGLISLQTDIIQYVTLATPSNATDFGDLTVARNTCAGTSDDTRGVIFGGFNSSNRNEIDYITISTPSNATDFGDLVTASKASAASSDGTTAITTKQASVTTQKITIQTTGNAANWLNLTYDYGLGTATSGNA